MGIAERGVTLLPQKTRRIARRFAFGAAEYTYATTRNEFLEKKSLKIALALQDKYIDEAIDRYKDDISIYQEEKSLGLFHVVDTTTKAAWHDPRNDFHIRMGENVLELHLPPTPLAKRTFSEVTASFSLIAQYMMLHDLTPKCIMGITYGRLAQVSRRQGFTVIQPFDPFSSTVQEPIISAYEAFKKQGFIASDKQQGEIQLCYQSTEDFLKRYGQPINKS